MKHLQKYIFLMIVLGSYQLYATSTNKHPKHLVNNNSSNNIILKYNNDIKNNQLLYSEQLKNTIKQQLTDLSPEASQKRIDTIVSSPISTVVKDNDIMSNRLNEYTGSMYDEIANIQPAYPFNSKRLKNISTNDDKSEH